SGPSCPVLEGAAAHVALGAEAGPPLYLKARRSQGPADMARRGVGREAAAGRGVAGDLGHERVAPEFGILRGREAVEEPGVGPALPARQRLARVARNDLHLGRAEGEAARARGPGGEERPGRRARLGEGGKGRGHVAGRHRESLETRVGEAARDAGRLPGEDGGDEVEPGAEAKFGDAEPVAEAAGQAVAGKKDVAGFGQPVLE